MCKTQRGFLVLGWAVVCLSTVACGAPKQTSETTIQTPTTTVTSKTTTGTDSSETNIDVRREVEPNPPVDPNNNTVIMGTDAPTASATDDDGVTHVRAPGVKIDADENSDKVDIKAPFVHIQKDSSGHTHIKTPFVNINTHESDGQ